MNVQTYKSHASPLHLSHLEQEVTSTIFLRMTKTMLVFLHSTTTLLMSVSLVQTEGEDKGITLYGPERQHALVLAAWWLVASPGPVYDMQEIRPPQTSYHHAKQSSTMW